MMKEFHVWVKEEDLIQLKGILEFTGTDEDIVRDALNDATKGYIGERKFKVEKVPMCKDITGSDIVMAEIRADGKVLWVNSEKGCVLRICQIKKFILEDRRTKKVQR